VSAKPVPTPDEISRPYFEAAARGELLIQRCSRCQTWFLYPRRWCPNCWALDPPWTRASGRGEVIACTIVYQAPYEAYAEDAPYALAIVRLLEGAQMMANVIGCDPRAVKVGTAVEVQFEPRGDVTIPQFRLVQQSRDEANGAGNV